ncbi:hypothetical protein [Delftia phage PhiW-14]|uniref:Uncharacterized protein n=1 Tax=Delftia phage PhiW-14 TaxID=665032 RepID=C9DGD5_BPW14|nr:hypothetical protein DP-phiW-14_gp165 [Delftia phage PhiW-14]ACV50186.1 hypothetical protein [Delftia phage PhiW-14]
MIPTQTLNTTRQESGQAMNKQYSERLSSQGPVGEVTNHIEVVTAWAAVMEATGAHSITAKSTDSMRLLLSEKGYKSHSTFLSEILAGTAAQRRGLRIIPEKVFRNNGHLMISYQSVPIHAAEDMGIYGSQLTYKHINGPTGLLPAKEYSQVFEDFAWFNGFTMGTPDPGRTRPVQRVYIDSLGALEYPAACSVGPDVVLHPISAERVSGGLELLFSLSNKPRVDLSKFTLASDKMPEKDGAYWVLGRDHNKKNFLVCTGWDSECKRWTINDGTRANREILMWLPLEEPVTLSELVIHYEKAKGLSDQRKKLNTLERDRKQIEHQLAENTRMIEEVKQSLGL